MVSEKAVAVVEAQAAAAAATLAEHEDDAIARKALRVFKKRVRANKRRRSRR
jgi:hypothetical protein